MDDVDPAVVIRAAVLSIWETGIWPTRERTAYVVERAETRLQERSPGPSVLTRSGLLASGGDALFGDTLDELVAAGELSEHRASDFGWVVLTPSVEVTERWLPLRPSGRTLASELLPNGDDHRAAAALGGAANSVYDKAEWAILQRPIEDADLLEAELRGRGEAWLVNAERLRRRWEAGESARPTVDDTLARHLEQGAQHLAQLGDHQRARRAWQQASASWLRCAAETSDSSRPRKVLDALVCAVLAGDGELEQAALAAVTDEQGLLWPWGVAWRNLLVGLLTGRDHEVGDAAARLDELDQRKRKGGTDVAVGSAGRAILKRDQGALTESLEQMLAQHLRYIRYGHQTDGTPCRTAMTLQQLARRHHLESAPGNRHVPDKVQIRAVDRWAERPTLRHSVRAPLCLLPGFPPGRPSKRLKLV